MDTTTSSPLTAEQTAVLAAVADVLTDRQVVERVGIDHSRVRYQMTRILLATGAASRTQAVRVATAGRWLD